MILYKRQVLGAPVSLGCIQRSWISVESPFPNGSGPLCPGTESSEGLLRGSGFESSRQNRSHCAPVGVHLATGLHPAAGSQQPLLSASRRLALQPCSLTP